MNDSDSLWLTPPNGNELRNLLDLDHEGAVVITSQSFLDSMLLFLLTEDGALFAEASRWGFAKKLDRARKQNLVTADEAAALRTMNDIRVNFAHNARAYLSDDAVEKLFEALPPALRRKAMEAGGSDSAFNSFRVCALILLTHFRTACERSMPT